MRAGMRRRRRQSAMTGRLKTQTVNRLMTAQHRDRRGGMTGDGDVLVDARRRALTPRGRDTRRRLLEATVSCLNAVGYSATTTQAVTEAAGVSRGSLLHQFQTRTHMMAAAAGFAMTGMIDSGRRRFAVLEEPVARLRALCRIIEEVQREPAAFALNEILLAARWEPELAACLRPLAENIERVMDADIVRMAAEAGVADPEPLRVRSRALIAAMRGFSMELMFNADRAAIHQAIRMTRADYDDFLSRTLENVA